MEYSTAREHLNNHKNLPSRLLLLKNGVTIGIFPHFKPVMIKRDNKLFRSNDTPKVEALLLESHGNSFTFIHESGLLQRKTLRYVGSTMKSQAKTVVDFRNMYGTSAPIVTRRLCEKVWTSESFPSQQFSPDGKLLSHWLLETRPTKSSVSKIRSLEGNAAIKLHSYRFHAKVRFLCEVRDTSEASHFGCWSTGEQPKIFTWVTRSFSTRKPLPQSFQKPLSVLLGDTAVGAFDDEANEDNRNEELNRPSGAQSPYFTTALPKPLDLTQPTSWCFVAESGHSCQPNQALPHEILELGTNLDEYLQIGNPALVEWNREGTYCIVEGSSQKQSNAAIIVEVFIHHDDSIMVLAGDYVQHYQQSSLGLESPNNASGPDYNTNRGGIPKVFHHSATDGITVRAVGKTGQRLEYHLGPIVKKAKVFRDQYSMNCNDQPDLGNVHEALPQNSASLLTATQSNPSCGLKINHSPSLNARVLRQAATLEGLFTAFCDFRIRVTFKDRTLLELGPCHQRGQILTKQGEQAMVNVENPHPFERYIQASLEFAQWAFLSTEEQSKSRKHLDRLNQLLDLERNKIRHFQHIYSTNSTHSMISQACGNPQGKQNGLLTSQNTHIDGDFVVKARQQSNRNLVFNSMLASPKPPPKVYHNIYKDELFNNEKPEINCNESVIGNVLRVNQLHIDSVNEFLKNVT